MREDRFEFIVCVCVQFAHFARAARCVCEFACEFVRAGFWSQAYINACTNAWAKPRVLAVNVLCSHSLSLSLSFPFLSPFFPHFVICSKTSMLKVASRAENIERVHSNSRSCTLTLFSSNPPVGPISKQFACELLLVHAATAATDSHF